MHKTNIIMMAAREHLEEGGGVVSYTLMSLCSQGVLAEWQVARGEDGMEIDEGATQDFQAINYWKLDVGAVEGSSSKLRHAQIDFENDRLVVYEQNHKAFLVYDLITKKLVS